MTILEPNLATVAVIALLTYGTLAQNLKQDPATGLRSSETKVGQRTVQMLVTLGSRRSEFVISPE
jgi:hypothetical protein